MKRGSATRACAAVLPLVLLGGCGLFGSGDNPNIPEARCRAAGAAALLGRPANDESIDAARAYAGAMRARVVPYRSPEDTRAIDPQRLNIEVDAQGVIQRLRCG